MPNGPVIQKLHQAGTQLGAIKSKGVEYRDDTEFSAWKDKGIKWLKLGGQHTSHEFNQFKGLMFMSFTVRPFGTDRYYHEDQQEYEKDCNRAIAILNSAIENIEMDLIPETPTEHRGRAKTGGSEFGGVNIAQAGTVVMGDKNIVAKIDSITVSDFLKVIEKEIHEKVQEPQQKTTLLQKVKDISQNPAVNTGLGQTIGQILRSMSGQ